MSFQYRFSFFHSLFFSFSFFLLLFWEDSGNKSVSMKTQKKETTRLVYDMLLTRHVVKYLPSRFFFSIFVNFEYWLTEIKSSSIKTAACVTSVSVWFWIKERPGNGIFGVGRARKEKRAILHRPLPPLPALLLTPFLARSLTLVPPSFPRTVRKLNACWAGYENMRT